MTKNTYLIRLGAAALLFGAAPSAPALAQTNSPAPAALVLHVRAASAHLDSIYQERLSQEKNPAKAQKLRLERDADITALDELVKNANNATPETGHNNVAYRVAAAHLASVYQERLKKNPSDQQLKAQRDADITALQELIRREQGSPATHH